VKAWFISDIHLKSLNERNGNILLRFLHSLQSGTLSATHLFLLGDIFDFWVGDHDFYPQKFGPIVDVLLDLKNKGVQVIYVEGNHDVHVKEFWKKNGVDAFVEDRYFNVGPWTIRVSHGDLMNPSDHKYHKYRNFIRHGFMETVVAQILPAKQLHQIGDWASRTSRKKSSMHRRDSESALRLMIHDYAEKCYAEKPFDFIVSGHMHFKDEWKSPTERFTSINLGSWFDPPVALVLDEGGYAWQELSGL